MNKKPIFKTNSKEKSQFSKVLKQAVHSSLGDVSKKGNSRILYKNLILLGVGGLSYSYILLGPNQYLKILACIIMGLSTAGLGFNLFHDSIHGSLSQNKKVNHLLSFFACSLLGAGHFMWRHKHNYLHHQFPNILEVDDDINSNDLLRMSSEQSLKWHHQFQHLYAIPIYLLITVDWLFIKDFRQYLTQKVNKWQRLPTMKFLDHVEFLVSKAIYCSFIIFIPLSSFTFPEFIIGFLAFHFSLGLALASMFQLGHINKECEFPICSDDSNQLDRDFFELQLSTTVNFATKSRFVTWYSGGLNYQIEHHLFPNLSHVFYPQIAPIVEKICAEFNYPYRSFPKYSQALRGHFKVLKHLGAQKSHGLEELKGQ